MNGLFVSVGLSRRRTAAAAAIVRILLLLLPAAALYELLQLDPTAEAVSVPIATDYFRLSLPHFIICCTFCARCRAKMCRKRLRDYLAGAKIQATRIVFFRALLWFGFGLWGKTTWQWLMYVGLLRIIWP